MSENFLPILIQAIVVVGFAVGALSGSVLLGRMGRSNPTKETPYECGVLITDHEQPRFSVKFYLVAMLFILFDIEIVFMYPWAVVFRDLIAEEGTLVLWSMTSFVLILTVGYVYALKKGALDWKN